MEELKYWIWLSRIEGLGPISAKKLLEKYKLPEVIWNLDKGQLLETGIGNILANKILDKAYKKDLEKYIEYMREKQY